MESKIQEVVISDIAIKSLEEIYNYGIETFSYASATVYIEELTNKINLLSKEYLMHPECNFITTKTHIYRNIIYGKYLVIYRIAVKIEVLNIIHSSRSVNTIKSARRIKL